MITITQKNGFETIVVKTRSNRDFSLDLRGNNKFPRLAELVARVCEGQEGSDGLLIDEVTELLQCAHHSGWVQSQLPDEWNED